jgi:hypothetical protein
MSSIVVRYEFTQIHNSHRNRPEPSKRTDRIGGVVVSVASLECCRSLVRAPLGQTKDYKIGICGSSTKHAALMRKSKDWLAWNQNNVFEWSDMFTRTHAVVSVS